MSSLNADHRSLGPRLLSLSCHYSEGVDSLPLRTSSCRRVVVITTLLCVVFVVMGPGASFASSTWGYGTPIGDASLQAADAYVVSMSCVALGDCTIVGSYWTSSISVFQGYVAWSTNGAWSNQAIEFDPGVENSSPVTMPTDVSCASVGNCAAVGYFVDSAGDTQAFVMNRTSGTWARAQPVQFDAGAQSSPPVATLMAVSCFAGGRCVAVGYFSPAAGGFDPFVVESVGGVWGRGQPIDITPGVLTATHNAQLESLSCTSPTACTATGNLVSADGMEPFTVSSVGGVWGQGAPVQFDAGVQSSSHFASARSVSCASAGNCTVVGYFTDPSNEWGAYAASSVGGTWSTASPIMFPKGSQGSPARAEFNDVFCVSAGECTAVGRYLDPTNHYLAFTARSVAGVWRGAEAIRYPPGTESATPTDSASAVFCVSAGECTAVGSHFNASYAYEGFVVSSVGGVWQTAALPVFRAGTTSTPPSDGIGKVFCVSVDRCIVAGTFVNSGGHANPFVVESHTASAPSSTSTTSTTVPHPLLAETGADSRALVMGAVLAAACGLLIVMSRRRIVST